MLQSVTPASYSLRTRLSRPELQAAKGRRQSGASSIHNNNDGNGGDSSQGASAASNNPMADSDPRNQELGSDDEGDGGGKKSKSRRELPAGAVQTLKAWLLSPEHFTHPYPTPQDQAMLMAKTGIDKKQLKNWFTNARRRIWKPMLKKQIEQGKLTTTGVPGVHPPGGVPGLMVPAMPGAPGGAAMDNPHSVQAMRVHYQQAVQGQPQQQPQQVTVDAYGNQVYVQQPHIHQQPAPPPPPPPGQPQSQPHPGAPHPHPQQQHQHQHQHQHQQPPPPPPPPPPQAPAPAVQDQTHSVQQYYLPPADSTPAPAAAHAPAPASPPVAAMPQSSSIGSLPPMTGSTSSGTGQLNKTDSHAVLMELFARDQDLVRQATESARMKAAAKKHEGGTGGGATGQQQQQHPAPLLPSTQQNQQQQQQSQQQLSSQHPMKSNSTARIGSVPSLNSWPHFSSISSLNNLGNMPGVKSITSMSGVDLANQGNVNKMGNLAQVKSMESMGKNDSYAFLEVFFGDRSLNSMNNLGGKGGADSSKGKREREEDNDVGLSLDDEGPSTTTTTTASSMKQEMGAPAPISAAPQPAPLTGGASAAGAAKDGNDTGTLKRAYDDAMAARGLISVSRSSEKLTDLALPAKMQRSLSQEYIRQNQNPQPQQWSYTPAPAPETATSSSNAGSQRQQQQSHRQQAQQSHHQQQYPGQHPGEPMQQQAQQHQQQSQQQDSQKSQYPANESSKSVEVPAATKCAICGQTNVDTQLRPCGHMFHERCLKPSLQSPVGPPKCPIDHVVIQSALLAVPTENPSTCTSTQPKQWNASNTATNQGTLSAEGHRTAS